MTFCENRKHVDDLSRWWKRRRCAEAAADYRLCSSLARKEAAAAEAVNGLRRAEACVVEVAKLEALESLGGDAMAKIESLSALLEYVDASPAALFVQRARAYFELGDLYACIGDAGRALKGDADSLEALELRGEAYYKLGDHAMAKTHWQEALKRDPEHEGCKAGYKLLRALVKKDSAGDKASAEGKNAAALEHWAAAVALDPHHAVFQLLVQLKMGRAHLSLKQHDAARRCADLALRLDAQSVDALLLKADALLADEQFEAAVRTTRQAREIVDDERTRQHQTKAEVALKQSKEVNYYKILGVSRTATKPEIKKAYRDQALVYHPDKVPFDATPAQKEHAETQFQKAASAYEILYDEDTRAKYDRGEDVSGNGQQGQRQHQHPFQNFQQQGGQRFQFHFNQ